MKNYAEDIRKDEHFQAVLNRYERIIRLSNQKIEAYDNEKGKPAKKATPRLKQMLLNIIALKRTQLSWFLHRKEFDEELIRSKERELDLEEARLRSRDA